MSKKTMMTLSVEGLNTFAREIQHEGVTHKVHSAGIGDEFRESARFRSLLKSLIFDHGIDTGILNDIGFSDEDASNLGLSIEDLTNEKTPPRSEWNE